MPALSVVIPARDAAATLPATLAALAAQEGAPDFEVVLADDGSSDATPLLAREAGARVVAAAAPGSSVGPAAARNAGIAAATAPLLAFTDADCEPTPAWLAAGAAALEDADLVQGSVSPPPGAPVGPFDRTVWVAHAHGLFESANLFARRELLEALGGFEPGLGHATGKELGEDAWLGWRAVRAGARVTFCEPARVHHAVFPRGAAGFAAERARLRFFPALARRMPELRDVLCWRRPFLTRRSAAFDLAATGALAAAAARRPAAVPVVALAAAPYAALAVRDVRARGRRVAAAEIAADAVGAAALAVGSVRARSLLL